MKLLCLSLLLSLGLFAQDEAPAAGAATLLRPAVNRPDP